MIAELIFKNGIVMILDDTGTWVSTHPDQNMLASLLNALAQDADLLPSAGFPYYEHLEELALVFEASFKYFDHDVRPPGTVY